MRVVKRETSVHDVELFGANHRGVQWRAVVSDHFEDGSIEIHETVYRSSVDGFGIQMRYHDWDKAWHLINQETLTDIDKSLNFYCDGSRFRMINEARAKLRNWAKQSDDAHNETMKEWYAEIDRPGPYPDWLLSYDD